MAQVLKVTKADKTVHVVPIANKNFYLHMNNKILSKSQQMKLEEITEKEAENLPYFDESYITADEAQGKVSSMQQEIDRLQKLLALKSNATPGLGTDPASASTPYAAEAPATSNMSAEEFTNKVKADAGVATGTAAANTAKAEDVIADIKEAKTVAEVNALFNGDTRKTVIDAATKKLHELNEAAK